MLCKLQTVNSLRSPAASLFSIRNSCTKLFVGGLTLDTNETVLLDAFKLYGEVIEVRVVCDPTSAISKGYGFVKFASETQAAIAQQQMNGQAIDGREIRVQYPKNQ